MHQPFQAMAQGEHDYSVDVFPIAHPTYGTLMVIGAQEGAIYITREQAKEFFGLVEPVMVLR